MSHQPCTSAQPPTCDPSDSQLHDAVHRFQSEAALILLVEDHCVNRDVALRTLRKLGFRAEAVTNGLEAIEALRAVAYDLVLMDVRMPEMNGLEATRVIREHKSEVLNPQIPIVALTADAMSGTREKCLEAGMDDYLSLPVSRQILAETIHAWLLRQKQHLRVAGPTHLAHEAAAPSTHAAFPGDQPWDPSVISRGSCPSV